MSRLDELTPHAAVTVVSVQWFGSKALELTYKDPAGVPDTTVRIVTENCRTLRFIKQGLEGE